MHYRKKHPDLTTWEIFLILSDPRKDKKILLKKSAKTGGLVGIRGLQNEETIREILAKQGIQQQQQQEPKGATGGTRELSAEARRAMRLQRGGAGAAPAPTTQTTEPSIQNEEDEEDHSRSDGDDGGGASKWNLEFTP